MQIHSSFVIRNIGSVLSVSFESLPLPPWMLWYIHKILIDSSLIDFATLQCWSWCCMGCCDAAFVWFYYLKVSIRAYFRAYREYRIQNLSTLSHAFCGQQSINREKILMNFIIYCDWQKFLFLYLLVQMTKYLFSYWIDLNWIEFDVW